MKLGSLEPSGLDYKLIFRMGIDRILDEQRLEEGQ
jgi:hypothetical protein